MDLFQLRHSITFGRQCRSEAQSPRIINAVHAIAFHNIIDGKLYLWY